jgi:GT2 family glycosyltransferase
MRLSVIIVTCNGRHHLKECLGSLLPQIDGQTEVVIVDNGSNDGTAEFVNSMGHPRVRYLPLGVNRGYAAGNNIGVADARGDWLFLLNNDTVCSPVLVRSLMSGTEKYPQFHVFSCRMIRALDGRIDNKGIRYSRLLCAFQIGSGETVVVEAPFEVFGASGGAMAVRRSVIDDIGLFEPAFFAYHEDVDFAVRARLAGYRCMYLPTAEVVHKGGGTSSADPSRFHSYNQRNMELVVLRSIPPKLLRKYGLGHLAYSGYQVLKSAVKGYGFDTLKAKIDAIGMWRKMALRSPRARVSASEFDRFLGGQFPAVSLDSRGGSPSFVPAELGSIE